MDVSDPLSRAFLPLALRAGIPLPTLARHLTIFQEYAEPAGSAVLLSRCVRPERPQGRAYLMLLTRTHLVVTSERRFGRQAQLHLAEPVRELHHVTWSPDPGSALVDLAIGTDRGRQRFCLRALHARQMWRLDAALGQVFQQASERERLAAVLCS